MTGAEAALAAAREALDGRRLIWFGIRGEDGEALLQLPELDASFAVIAALRSASIRPEANVCLEDISGRRLDLDRPDVDRDVDHGDAAEEFRARLLREVSGRCVLMTYRPSTLTSALAFSMSETMTLAGMYRERQLAFEHKPWVERSLERRGVRGLEWRYVADEHRVAGDADGPRRTAHPARDAYIGRRGGRPRDRPRRRSNGHWPRDSDAFAALSPYLEPTIPLNVTGCVFADGSLRLHPPSVQLIGIASCTDRRFGYCGNDFGPVAAFGDDVLGQLDDMARTVAAWLHEERYVGVFGLDALLHDDKVHFTEINARFQGSSALSAEIAGAARAARRVPRPPRGDARDPAERAGPDADGVGAHAAGGRPDRRAQHHHDACRARRVARLAGAP